MSEINAIHVLNIPRQDYVYPSQGKSFENRYLIIDGANQNQPYVISQQFVLVMFHLHLTQRNIPMPHLAQIAP